VQLCYLCTTGSAGCNALQVGNTWRTTQVISMAITATWDSIMNNLGGSTGLARFAGPGGWNDMDLMEVGGCPACMS
jgi:hypothetical protein